MDGDGTLPTWLAAAGDFAILVLLIALAVTDLRRMIIPDRLTAGIGVIAALLLLGADRVELADHVLGAVLGFAMFEATRRVMTWRLKRDAMGFGDVKLMAAAGLWIGATDLPLAALIACLAALAGLLLMAMAGRRAVWRAALPFGPFLAFGLVAARFIGVYAPLWL